MSDSVAEGTVAGIVAAAGLSVRMGRPKQLLPWGNYTVLTAVVHHLVAGGVDPVVVVIGHQANDMRAALQNAPAYVVENPEYLTGEMFSSYRTGIRYLLDLCHGGDAIQKGVAHSQSTAGAWRKRTYLGCLLALGDQPHIPISAIKEVVKQAQRTPDRLVIPSYAMRRGHPFYLPERFWAELLALGEAATLRDVVEAHKDEIVYVAVDTDAILRDLDTPTDYRALVQGEGDSAEAAV